MMINLTIDTSVFGLPENSDNFSSDIKNFLQNMLDLQELDSYPFLTISLMDRIPLNLGEINCCANKKMVEDNLANEPGESIYDPDDIFLYYHKLCDILEKPKKYKLPAKGNFPEKNIEEYKGTGIHWELPAIENENNGNPKIRLKGYNYPKKKYEKLFPKFEQYALRIARLNKTYKAYDHNYLIIDGDYSSTDAVKVSAERNVKNKTICYESKFNLCGIHRIKEIIEKYDPKLEICSVSEAAISAKNNFADDKLTGKLIFLPDVNKDRIEEKLAKDAGPPSRIYYYLQTLFEISKKIANGDLKLQHDNGKPKRISDMINAFGCLCSSESQKYVKANCTERRFTVHGIDKKVFSLHLKPCTADDAHTARIYFDFDRDGNKFRFRIAFIGHHPLTHGKCGRKGCPNYPNSDRKKEYNLKTVEPSPNL